MKPKNKLNIDIEAATNENAPYIAEIEKECFSLPWSEKQIEEEIKNPDTVFLTAKAGNKIYGYVSGRLISGEFYISNIAVRFLYRGNNIGGYLIYELLERLKALNCHSATLEVRESNMTARKLYERFGFKNLGIRKNFYTEPLENACIYALFF